MTAGRSARGTIIDPEVSSQVHELEVLPVLGELSSADFGGDFSWVADDLFARPHQGLMRTSGGSLVVYRNCDLRTLAISKHLTHQTVMSGSSYWRRRCPAHVDGLLSLFGRQSFSKRSPDHLPLKKLSSRRFTQQGTARFESAAVGALEAGLAAVAGGASCDFVHDFAKPVMADFWSRVFGLARGEGERLVELAGTFQLTGLMGADPEQISAANAAGVEYMELLTHALEREARTGANEVLSELAADFAEMPELGRPDNPFAAVAANLVDGFHTLGALMANVIHALLDNEAAHASVRRDPTLVRVALLEGVRLHPALVLITREAQEDFVYEDVRIPAGAAVLMMWLFGNRDPAVFSNPNTYVLNRTQRSKQLEFGGGLYVCLGRHVSRMLSEKAIRIFTRPKVEIAPTGKVTWARRSGIHEMVSMPVAIRCR